MKKKLCGQKKIPTEIVSIKPELFFIFSSSSNNEEKKVFAIKYFCN